RSAGMTATIRPIADTRASGEVAPVVGRVLVAPRADQRGDSVVEIGDAIGRLDPSLSMPALLKCRTLATPGVSALSNATSRGRVMIATERTRPSEGRQHRVR